LAGLAAISFSLVVGIAACVADEAKPVVLIIDYGDGVQKHFTKLVWRNEMTVLDAMLAAQAHPRGVRFEHQGSAATALLTRIDDVKNEGRGRNWLFRVNGKLADRSFGIVPLQPGDTILWRFEEYR